MLIDAQLRRSAIHGVITFVDVTAGRNWVKPLNELLGGGRVILS